MHFDLVLAARRLLATPLFTAFAVLSLAAGVGVTTAIYSVVDALFLRGSRIVRPDEVGLVAWPRDGRFVPALLSEPDFRDLREAQRSFSPLSASTLIRPTVTSSSTTETVTAEAVDGAYFSTLGATSSLGRVIQVADDDSGARVAVLSWKLWRERYAADPAIVGRTVRIAGQTFEVIGVAQEPFAGPGVGLFGTALWLPLSVVNAIAPSGSIGTSSRDRRTLRVFGRLAPGATLAGASVEMNSIAAALDQSFPPPAYLQRSGQSERAWSAKSVAAVNSESNPLRRLGLVLAGFVALVLVVACTNLSNLVLARGTMRQREFAIRHALGASRWRLIREQCVESLLLAIAGGVGSYMVFRIVQLLMTADFSFPIPMGGRWTLAIRPDLDATAVAMAAASLLISLLVFGLEPAWQLTRSRDIRSAIAASTDGGGPGRTARHRLLLRWQIAVSAGFFIVATMFVKYTIAEAIHDPGVDMSRLAVAVLSVQAHGLDEAHVRRTLDRVLEESRTDSAIEAVSASTGLPFGVAGTQELTLRLSGSTNGKDDVHAATAIAATPAIFRTLRVPILRGRGFDDRDQANAEPVVVLSEFAARKVFGASDVVGRQVIVHRSGSKEAMATVIGIARDTDVRAILDDPRPFVYLPMRAEAGPVLAIAARSTGTASQAVQRLREMLRQADPDLAVDAIGTGRDILAGPFVFLRAMGMTTVGLGTLTLLLAMAGLFGIQSHIVSNRTREIGVRMSFGASTGQIQWMILKDGIRPVFEGLAIGLLIGLAGRGIVRWYMELDVTIVDPWMLAVVPIPLILAGFCACFLPAQRAAAIDPNIALRHL